MFFAISIVILQLELLLFFIELCTSLPVIAATLILEKGKPT